MPDPATLHFLRAVLSTITSPAFSKVVILYEDGDFCGLSASMELGNLKSYYRFLMPDEIAEEASWHRQMFEVFRGMHAVRDFQLVLCADVWDPVGEYTIEALKQAIVAEAAANRLDYLPSKPLVVYSPRGCQNPWFR